jgi:uncharacterized protein YkwD
VSPQAIEDFVVACAWQFEARPSPADLADLEDRFAVHLTLLNSEHSSSQKKSQSMDELAERLPAPMEEEYPEQEGNRAVDILNSLQLSFEKEENFKHLCNTVFKGVKFFTQDPTNLVFSTIPLKYDDLEHNEAVVTQIQYLCSEFDIEFDAKEKGALLTFRRNDPAYVREVSKLMEAFKQHKDESIVKKVQDEEKRKGYNPMDPNRSERVEAYFEAKRLRGIVGPAPVTMSESKPRSSNPFYEPEKPQYSQEMAMAMVDYPEPPQNPQNQPQSNKVSVWNGVGEDPLAQRFKYKVDDTALRANANSALSHHNQLNEYRNKVRFNNHTAVAPREQFMSWGQLSNKIDTEDQEVLGKLCLEWTNKFRQSQGKPPLKWEPLMFKIAFKHSKDMGDKKVPFDHVGFNQRCKDMPFSKQGAGENLAYIGNVSRNEIPKAVVDGWINSPGHRKNLLGNWNVCTIAGYKNSSGMWYFTQLFALKY